MRAAINGRWATMLVVLLALGGCSRPGPDFTPVLPGELAAAYATAQQAGGAAAWATVGRLETGRRHWLAAVEAYEAALAADPTEPEALAGLALLRLNHGENAAAAELARRLDQANPDHPDIQATVGELYTGLNERELALASYRRALDLDPNQALAILRLGQEALRAGDNKVAVDHSLRLLVLAPEADETVNFALAVSQQTGNQDRMESLLRASWERERSPGARARLAAFYLGLRRWEAARAVNEQWLADHPDDVPARLSLAEILRRQERLPEARRALQELARTADRDPRVQLALGRVLLAEGRRDEGMAALGQVRKLAPADSGLLLQAADLFAQHDERTSALDLYRQIERDDPQRRAEVARRLGIMAQQAGAGTTTDNPDADPIEASYLYVLRQQPDDILALNNLAFHYADQNRRLEAAEAMINRALELRPGDPNVLDTAGWIAVRQGKLEAAADLLGRAAARRPDDPGILYHQAVLAEARGNRPAALNLARRALASGDEFHGKAECEALLAKLEGGQ